MSGYMDYWRSNRDTKRKSYYYDDYDSIYDYDYNTENKVTRSVDSYKEKYKNGYSASSYWLSSSYSFYGKFETEEKQNEQKLKESLAFICRSVNIIRHRYGMGSDKSLSVQWADNLIQFNSSDNDVVYLNPSPLLDKNEKFSDNQRYDVIVGQALLSSVQKHLINNLCTNYANHLLTINQNVSVVCEKEKLKTIVLDKEGKKVSQVIYTEGDSTKKIKKQDYLNYDGNTTSFGGINIEPIYVNGAVQIWRAIEQVIAETAISNEYRGSIAYLYSHRNYYNDPKYLASLKQAVKVLDKNNADSISFILAVHNVLNDNQKIEKSDCNEFYHEIIDMID
ncbi:MAG: hypothetical protein RL348_1543, partial [Bacteroidota bacterium]